ncbi:SDR family NAD(P)-dependent oxidoreductase [Novosphingobium pokkalii]|uniref:SDR family NAD(P)-dependent oxidoreductase n=1 Tax=Novosphingobium pokkalii TaxID=1770194 RepID=A0ABV7V7K9_9SPHN|nr:SDR family oxidoreductase [Novosphingobium pokkalii]GHC98421.1 short-chain dehydrogenase [Novosphingobium pokkalii]
MSTAAVGSTPPVAIVTGGSGGMAPGIVRGLRGAGIAVVITARDAGRLAAAAETIGGDCLALASDARDPASIESLVAAVLARHGRIDVLVNAAASSTPISGAIETVDVAALIADLDVKVGGYLRYAQAVVPAMKRQGRGHIVNIGGLTGRSSDTLSGLRNAAVSHLTKVLSDQLGPAGITVNAVHPGIVRTPHLAELFAEMAHAENTTPAAIEARFVAEIPTRTILTPDDVGAMVATLAAAARPTITGQSLTIDGGYSRGIFL